MLRANRCFKNEEEEVKETEDWGGQTTIEGKSKKNSRKSSHP